MKIVMLLANNFTDSAWTDPRVYKEAQALLQAGHEVVILATGKYGQDAPRRETKDGLRIIRCPTLLHRLYGFLKPARKPGKDSDKKRKEYYQKETQGIRTEITERVLQFLHDLNSPLFCLASVGEAVRQKADVYIGHDLSGLFPAYLAARLTGAPLVYDSHELWTERVRAVPYGRLQKAVVTWFEGRLARRCDLVITMSHSVAKILAERYHIPEPLVIPNAHPYVESAPSAEIRAQLTGGVDRPVVVFVGYLGAGRGLEQLIDAAEYLDRAVVAIVGDGVSRPVLEARVKAKRLEDRVRFIGWVTPDRLPDYVASADLGVSALQSSSLNYYYNIDNKFFHYVIAGIPLAVSDQPEKRQLVERYRIGATFDETDPRDMARVINGLLSDPLEYEAMRDRCRKAAREELNWEFFVGRYVSAIEKLVDLQFK